MVHDIVYILRNGTDSDEIRYSLRTVERNFPHRKVWFFGGLPEDIHPDEYVEIKQKGGTPWERSTGTVRYICETDEITSDFWLFNDDFFVLEPVRSLPYMYRGQLKDHTDRLLRKSNINVYAYSLIRTEEELTKRGLTTYDYALHVPMLINRKKGLEVLNTFRNPMFRSLYGNYCNVGGVRAKDVKITDLQHVPEEGQQFCSTNEASFKDGNVGRYIRERFTEPSKWEKL